MQNRNDGEYMEMSRNSTGVTVLELTVNNHPGVMSHICGLFSRRVYNVEGIVCLPVGDGEISRIWLRINESTKLQQVVKQLQKLPDVYSIAQVDDDKGFFGGLMEKAAGHYASLE